MKLTALIYVTNNIISGQTSSNNDTDSYFHKENSRKYFPITSDSQEPKVILARRLIYLLIFIGIVKILKSFLYSRNDRDRKPNKLNNKDFQNNSRQGGDDNVRQ